MTTVLLAEDDPAISEPLARALQREGYEVLVRNDGASALSEAMSGDVDLVVLDLGLPGHGRPGGVPPAAAPGATVPVLMLTARTDEVDIVVGLDAGADDYVAKPFRLAELLARVRALLRRRTGDVLEVSGVRMELASRRVWQDDVELQLTNKEFELLRVLLRRPARWSPATGIMREVWDDAEWRRVQDAGHAHVLAAPQARRRPPAVAALHHHRARRRLPVRARLSTRRHRCAGGCCRHPGGGRGVRVLARPAAAGGDRAADRGRPRAPSCCGRCRRSAAVVEDRDQRASRPRTG